jgi:hypothetical protein
MTASIKARTGSTLSGLQNYIIVRPCGLSDVSPTLLIVTSSSLLAGPKNSYTGNTDFAACLSMITLLIDCSECLSDAFTGTVMSYDYSLIVLFYSDAMVIPTAVQILSISRKPFSASLT